MPVLPAAVAFTAASVTEGAFKSAITDQREFIASLIGTLGTLPNARQTLGVLGNNLVAKTAAYTIVAGDLGDVFVCSNTFTLSLTAAATLGDGFVFALRNDGVGIITIDPSGAELIDGAATITVGPGQSCLIFCNAVGFKSLGLARVQNGYRCIGNNSFNNAGTPNTQFDMFADDVILADASGNTIEQRNPATLTNNLLTAGSAANGRDQAGAFTANTFIHFYWIWNGTALATLSSAIAPPTGPTMPSGYTHWAYCGAVYFPASALRKVRIKGSWITYESPISALAAGGATAETAIGFTTIAPANALNIDLGLSKDGTSDSSGIIDVTTNIRAVTGVVYFGSRHILRGAGATANQQFGQNTLVVPNIGQQIFYLMTNSFGTGTLSVVVRRYQVPNGGE